MDEADADAAFEEGRAEGFREGMAAGSCGCGHRDDCALSENYREPWYRRLAGLWRGATS